MRAKDYSKKSRIMEKMKNPIDHSILSDKVEDFSFICNVPNICEMRSEA